MKPLIIKSVPNSPDVEFNPENGCLEISGISMPENARMFFLQLMEWIENYVKTGPTSTTMNVKISYLNSGSHSYISDLFKKLEPLHQNGKQVTVNWYFETDDREIEEIGKACRETTSIPFQMIAVDSF